MSTTFEVALLGVADEGPVFGLREALDRHPRFAVRERAAGVVEGRQIALAGIEAESGQVFPVLTQRFQPAVRSAAGAVASGRLGLPWNIQADYVVTGHGGGAAGHGSTLLSLAADPLDVVIRTLGLPVRRVLARVHGPVETPNLLTIHADHDKGATSTVVVSRVPRSSDTAAGDLARQRYRISGSHGVLLVDATKPRLTLRTASGTAHRWSAPGAMDALLDAVAAALDGVPGAAPNASVGDAIESILATAQESIRQRKVLRCD